MPQEQGHPLALVPLGAALAVFVDGVLWALSWERRVCRRKHTLCRLRLPLENSSAQGKQRQLSLKGSCTDFFQTH